MQYMASSAMSESCSRERTTHFTYSHSPAICLHDSHPEALICVLFLLCMYTVHVKADERDRGNIAWRCPVLQQMLIWETTSMEQWKDRQWLADDTCPGLRQDKLTDGGYRPGSGCKLASLFVLLSPIIDRNEQAFLWPWPWWKWDPTHATWTPNL